MKESNVSNMTTVETVDVKKAGGGIVVVPATDEIHRLKRRLNALEAHDKCQNCAVSPYIEAEKHTCGECRIPWSREFCANPEHMMLVVCAGRNGELQLESHVDPACPKFNEKGAA